MKPRRSSFTKFALLLCVASVTVWVAARADNVGKLVRSEGDLFRHLYGTSITNLDRPDMTFEDIEDVDDALRTAEPVSSSKTCSQRCSQRCSKSCTTTRGCSSLCKSQTEGCGGTAPARTTQLKESASAVVRPSDGPLPRSIDQPFTITDLQMLLKIAGYSVALDGKLGRETYTAVTDFQGRNGLAPTGVADAELWKALCVSLSALAGSGPER